MPWLQFAPVDDVDVLRAETLPDHRTLALFRFDDHVELVVTKDTQLPEDWRRLNGGSQARLLEQFDRLLQSPLPDALSRALLERGACAGCGSNDLDLVDARCNGCGRELPQQEVTA